MNKIKTYFNPPFPFKNKHFSTIVPALFRKVKSVDYQRERINTPDSDFLDLDFSKTGSKEIIIILHGLEGNSKKAYVKGLVRIMNRSGIDSLSLNLRGCSEEDNNNFYSYHSGKTEDLDLVINYLSDNYNYEKIYLAGFSLGGNIVLKYAGEQAENMNPKIKAIIAISVPCDLRATSYNFLKKSNFLYQYRFIRSLRKKALNKIKRFPEYQHLEKEIKACRTFFDFDNLITAPYNGFRDAEDYWKKCSSKQFISSIKIPTLLINALDDPFLTQESYPYKEVKKNPFFILETPKYGGHVGFINRWLLNKVLWHEEQALKFIKKTG
ncbi:MAG: alpha/beta fold hydrolase [Bacteroidales bacterium]|nr:alpha/beta fold hydrolase [Bacteroidales bacterium]